MAVRQAPGERGTLAVELVVLAPVIVVFGLLALGLGRYELARQQVVGAAQAGAQAAAVASNPASAQALARVAALADISSTTRSCPHPSVTTDVSDFSAGGDVRVTVTCQVHFSDLAVPGLPGTTTLHRSSVAPIDPYRVVG
jgi:Flp pilus assembly protein TadG